jgi:glycosyltransferase involved in cell wall biosynthesis
MTPAQPSPLRALVVTAMFPTAKSPVRGIAVRREVDSLRDRGVAIRVISKAPGWMGYARQLRIAAGVMRRDPALELVHAHYGTSALIAAVARLVARRRNLPLVVTLHGSDVATGPRPQWSRYWVQYWMSIVGCLAARRVIVQDEEMRVRLPARVAARAEVLGQGVDPARFAVDAERDAGRVLFLSDRRRPVKRFWLAEAAVSRVRGQSITLDTLDLHAIDAIPAAMARAAIGLITSEREGMPVALKEALAAGLPVLAVDLPPLRRIAARFPRLLTLVPADAAALAGALERLLDSGPPSTAERADALAAMAALGWTEPARSLELTQLYELTARSVSSRTLRP